MATGEAKPGLHCRILFRPDAFNRVANGEFETDTSGWTVSAGINAAGSSLSRTAVNPISGAASLILATGSNDGGGANYDFGSQPFYQENRYGTAYVALVWLRRASGTGIRARIILGSEGTSSDRATLTIPDVPDTAQPYRVVWYPSGTRTDVQLAITNGGTAGLTMHVDAVSVYQLDAFNQVENSNFLFDTSGWSTSAGINGAGTSITRNTGTGPTTSTYATVVTTATNGSGVNYDLGSRPFVSGRTYRARVALRHGSGGVSARLRLGSLGTGADRGDKTVAVTTAWAWHYVDWTASGDRTDVELAVGNASASALTVDIGAVEVYEAIDEVNGDAGRADVAGMTWTRSTSAVGTITASLTNKRAAQRYTPWDSSGALYGLLRTGRRIWARAYFAGRLNPVCFGTIRRWVPDPDTETCQVLAEDPTADIAKVGVTAGFADDRSYRTARSRLFGATAVALGNDPVAGDARRSLSSAHTEAESFYDGTNGEVSALDYLNSLNDATGTVHHIDPSALPEILWRYTTVARETLTDASSATAIDGDELADISGMDVSDETVENQQVVPWQAYERLVVAGTTLVQARDPGSYTDIDADDPYLHYLRDDIGTDEDVPEPTYEREVVWKRRRVRKSRKRVRVRTIRFRRVYPDAFVPFTLSASTEKAWAMTFSVPVVIDGVATAHPSATPATVAYSQSSPRDVAFRAYASGASTTGSVRITGAAWLPLEEETYERTNHAAVLTNAGVVRPGPVTNTPYVGSFATAEGLAKYREWRFGDPRLRPTLHNEHGVAYATALNTMEPTARVEVSADKYALSSAPFVVTGVSGSVSGGGLLWAWDWALEALPPSIGTLFVLDTSELGGSEVLSY